jgi:NitT/TauT family transport system ATP-binding protein
MRDVPHIKTQNLSLSYQAKGGTVIALQDVSIDVPPRSFLTVVGPSGCGKTSLLKALSGALQPTVGTVTLDGAPVASAALAGKIGYVFQRPLLLPWRTALENVAFTSEIARKHVSRQQRLADGRKWLEVAGLAGFEDCYPHELSGGMQQRVSLSRALAFEPAILMMDEPFAALDEITRETMQDELLRMWSLTQNTVIFITHSISEAVLLSERIVVMTARPGRVAEVIDVPFPRPRDASIRATSEFTDLVEHIRRKLRQNPEA